MKKITSKVDIGIWKDKVTSAHMYGEYIYVYDFTFTIK